MKHFAMTGRRTASQKRDAGHIILQNVDNRAELRVRPGLVEGDLR